MTTKSLSTALLAVLLLSGCVSVDREYIAIDIDPDLEHASQSHAIVKADELWEEDELNITMGPYRVSKADRSWRRTGTTDKFDFALLFDNIDNIEYNTKQTVKFVLNGDSNTPWQTRCEKRTKGERTDIKLGHNATMRNQTAFNLAYRCGFQSLGKRWELVIDYDSRRGSQAYFKAPDNQQWAIETFADSTTHRNTRQNRRSGYQGFYLMADNTNIAAVSTLPYGQVWFKQGLSESEQDLMAMATVGLWFLDNGFYDEP